MALLAHLFGQAPVADDWLDRAMQRNADEAETKRRVETQLSEGFFLLARGY